LFIFKRKGRRKVEEKVEERKIDITV